MKNAIFWEALVRPDVSDERIAIIRVKRMFLAL
jgi:hypothetical protein